ncbi:MAG: alpha/beta hydrolase family protein [Microthrixaceae bacterium]
MSPSHPVSHSTAVSHSKAVSPSPAHRMTRRSALGTAAFAGTAAVVAACTDESARAGTSTSVRDHPPTTVPAATVPPTTTPDPGAPTPVVSLFEDPSFDFDARLALGAAAYGSTEVGEVLTAVNTINAAGPTYQTFVETFMAWGDEMTNQAAAADRAGDDVTRTERALRAAAYYEHALFFVLGTTMAAEEEQVYDKLRANWDVAVPHLAPVVESFEIPYDPQPMPAWFFAPDDSGAARPTIILNNGSDGQVTDMWTYGAAAAIERGWNALIFDGPGQGSMLFRHKLPFRADWEHVISPIVDVLTERDDVDSDRIALFGISMAGELVTRAAAKEHRLAALITAPGSVEVWLAFPEELRSIVSDEKGTNEIWNEFVVPALDPSQHFELAKRLEPYGEACITAARRGELPTDFWAPSSIIRSQNVREVAKEVTCPTLVIDYELETFYPGQAEELYDLLTTEHKEFVRLTAAQGAQWHCSPLAPRVHNEVVFDWLQRTLG